MVSFRLTDEEYIRFRRLCISYGARNVSELVRTAVSQMMDQLIVDEVNVTDLPSGAISHLPEMQLRVEHLESRLAELISTVGKLEGSLTAGRFAPHGNAFVSEGVSGRQAKDD